MIFAEGHEGAGKFRSFYKLYANNSKHFLRNKKSACFPSMSFPNKMILPAFTKIYWIYHTNLYETFSYMKVSVSLD